MNDLAALQERAKELRCLYQVHEIVSRRRHAPPETFLAVLEVIPEGWQRPATTGARIEYLGRHYVGPGYSSIGQTIREPIRLHGVDVGFLEVSDTEVPAPEPCFLAEERELLANIAHRLGEYLEWKHTELLGERTVPNSVHWRWRLGYVEALAAQLPAERFGVAALLLGGSTCNGEAGPGSDIDLVVVFTGDPTQRERLEQWLEGWSLCLGELAHRHTGYAFPEGLLNVQWVAETPDLRRRPDLRPLTLGPSAQGGS